MACRDMFPTGADEMHNPAIRLFGNRLISEQSPIESLVELLLVAASPKRIGDDGETVTSALPDARQLIRWRYGTPLIYAPRARLNLKLLAFLGMVEGEVMTFRRYLAVLRAHMDGLPELCAWPGQDADERRKNLEAGLSKLGA